MYTRVSVLLDDEEVSAVCDLTNEDVQDFPISEAAKVAFGLFRTMTVYAPKNEG